MNINEQVTEIRGVGKSRITSIHIVGGDCTGHISELVPGARAIKIPPGMTYLSMETILTTDILAVHRSTADITDVLERGD